MILFINLNFNAFKLSSYDFFKLYTTLPHNLMKDKLIDLADRTFSREHALYLARNEERALSSLEPLGSYLSL